MSCRKFILITLIVSAPGFLVAQEAEPEYEVVRQDEKITLYERWTFFPGTTVNSRQIKAVFQTNVLPDKMFTAITDETKIKEWQIHIIEHKYIPKNDSAWHTYSLYDIPWPLTDQDYLLSYTLKERTDDRMVLSFQYSLNEKLAPVREDIDRMPTIGQWELEKLSNGKTQVTYTATSKPVSYPRFITDRIVRNNLMSTMHALIEAAEKN
jgi:uncharacterized protein YndB with AHSA1/START domain